MPPTTGVPRMQYDTTQDDRLWAMLSYLLAFIASFIAPLIIYLVKKDSSRYVAFHALQSLLLHAAAAVVGIACFVAAAVFGMLGPLVLLAIPLFLVQLAVGIGLMVLLIVAAIKSFGGEWYEIPYVGRIARRQVGV